MLWKISSFCTTHKSSVRKGFTEQIMPILRILCYNGSLVTWTVVGLTTAKFKPLGDKQNDPKALHWYITDLIENDASNNCTSFCVFIATGTFIPSRYLATMWEIRIESQTEMGSGVIQNFIKIRSGIQILGRGVIHSHTDTHTHTHTHTHTDTNTQTRWVSHKPTFILSK
jgi:hypothetical protein